MVLHGAESSVHMKHILYSIIHNKKIYIFFIFKGIVFILKRKWLLLPWKLCSASALEIAGPRTRTKVEVSSHELYCFYSVTSLLSMIVCHLLSRVKVNFRTGLHINGWGWTLRWGGASTEGRSFGVLAGPAPLSGQVPWEGSGIALYTAFGAREKSPAAARPRTTPPHPAPPGSRLLGWVWGGAFSPLAPFVPTPLEVTRMSEHMIAWLNTYSSLSHSSNK